MDRNPRTASSKLRAETERSAEWFVLDYNKCTRDAKPSMHLCDNANARSNPANDKPCRIHHGQVSELAMNMSQQTCKKQSPLKRFTMLLTTFISLTCVVSFPVAANTFNVELVNDEISVEANNANLRELLAEIEKRTGIPVKFVEDAPEERVSVTVGLTTLEKVIEKITPNHMIVRENKGGTSSIKEVIIIPASSGNTSDGSTSSFLPTGEPVPGVTPEPEEMAPQNEPRQNPQQNPQQDNGQLQPPSNGLQQVK